MPLSRRTFLSGAAGAGALLVVPGRDALASPLGGRTGVEDQTSRPSRLFPASRVAHADLHNHTLNSDGDGDPAKAFASMRDAGLDVAALTDHSTVSKALPGDVAELSCAAGGCALTGVNERSWEETASLADGANADGSFTAIRGFEWSSPTLGHINVWFSQDWIDPLSTNGNTTGEGLAQFSHRAPGVGPAISPALDAAVRALPSNGTGMRGFYDWLSRDPKTPLLAGGADAIAGFNHPGREPGRFGYFSFDQRLVERIVSLEVFNRGEDYLFEGLDDGFASPIAECLDAGWRVGLTGVSDEHGTDWGYPDGKGRTGLWVSELTRAGVREAMQARRFFSTRLRGLRLDAAMNGVRMGQVVGHRSGQVRMALDLNRGTGWAGRPLVAQLLQTGRPLPTIVHQEAFAVPRDDQPVVSFSAPIDVEDGRWVVLRIVDPAQEVDARAPAEYTANGGAIAYAAPFFLDPDLAPAAPGRPANPGGGNPGGPPAGTPGGGNGPGSGNGGGAGGGAPGGRGPGRQDARTLPATGGETAAAAVGAAALGAAALSRLARVPGAD